VPSEVADHTELLHRFQPRLRYDSNEAFFADSAAEWTDHPGNVLRRTEKGEPSEVIAVAPPGTEPAQLALDFLGASEYSNGQPVSEDDVISAPPGNYRAMYVKLREKRPELRNRMYGRAKEDSRGRLWLQYWFYYFYNDYNLAGGIGLHEGDWEMVQFRMDSDLQTPDLAVYAQHVHAEQASWQHVETLSGSPDTPIVYVARGSHASYFDPGAHETEAWLDIADGKRKAPKLELEIIGDDPPGWILWPGRWGDTRARVPKIDQPSPRGPAAKTQWDRPETLRDRAVTHERPKALPAPEVKVERRNGRLAVSFDFPLEGLKPGQLVVTVNSPDDKLPPRTFTFALERTLRGTIETRLELDEHHRYDIAVSVTDVEGRPSESNELVLIGAAGDGQPFSERARTAVRGIVGRFRRRG